MSPTSRLKSEISHTYLLTPWCRVLLEKLTGLQLVEKFPAFHRTRRFITALTSVRHLSLSWDSPIQSIYPHPTSWRSILILSTHLCLGLPSGLFPPGFPTKTLYTPSPHPYAPHAQPISFFSILSPAHYWVRSTNHLPPRYSISSIPPFLFPPRSKYSPQHHVLKHPQLPFLPQYQRPSFTPIQNNRQNYSSIYLDLLIFWYQTGRQKILHPMIASISWPQSDLHFFRNRIFICKVVSTY